MTREAGELFVFETPADVTKALADLFVRCGQEAIAAHGRLCVSLSGGTTPKATYELLATPGYAGALDWTKIEVFFGDERCVPPDDPQSNYKTANDAFLSKLGVPAANVHRMRGEDDPVEAASAYSDELRNVLGADPRFDLVMLGMGPDGHTASLFPGSDPLEGDDMLARAVYSASHQQWRITLTPRVLNNARTVAFAVEGAGKAFVLKEVREGPYDPVNLPSQIIAPHDGRLVWLVDRAAAG
ncbi:MAG: 6-phosphogluconolactonase [Candidatus Eremiobacteraeota bacterium]|nr:6-phosphogluconolactonase [Candidatus Eremiobacteraeota bacterium]